MSDEDSGSFNEPAPKRAKSSPHGSTPIKRWFSFDAPSELKNVRAYDTGKRVAQHDSRYLNRGQVFIDSPSQRVVDKHVPVAIREEGTQYTKSSYNPLTASREVAAQVSINPNLVRSGEGALNEADWNDSWNQFAEMMPKPAHPNMTPLPVNHDKFPANAHGGFNTGSKRRHEIDEQETTKLSAVYAHIKANGPSIRHFVPYQQFTRTQPGRRDQPKHRMVFGAAHRYLKNDMRYAYLIYTFWKTCITLASPIVYGVTLEWLNNFFQNAEIEHKCEGSWKAALDWSKWDFSLFAEEILDAFCFYSKYYFTDNGDDQFGLAIAAYFYMYKAIAVPTGKVLNPEAGVLECAIWYISGWGPSGSGFTTAINMFANGRRTIYFLRRNSLYWSFFYVSGDDLFIIGLRSRILQTSNKVLGPWRGLAKLKADSELQSTNAEMLPFLGHMSKH